MILTAEDYRKFILTIQKFFTEELLVLLNQSEFFKRWSLENKVLLSERANFKEIKRGTVLFDENMTINSVFLIKNGEIEVFLFRFLVIYFFKI
jgi:hypothetical protein